MGRKGNQLVIVQKRQKFEIADKWYMHKPESVLENEMHEILWDFEILTYYPLPTKRPAQVLINKERTCLLMDFAFTVGHGVKEK